ncbi:MAG: isochorismatase family protein [Chloroflexi bacterium]|nr:isochorismatase family protein [Chloroflexota bacterium]
MQLNLRAEPESIEFDASRSALCVIDMQNYDIKPGGFFDLTGVDTEHGRRVIPTIQRALAYARAAGMPVLFTRMVIPADPMLRAGLGSPWYWKSAAYRADLSDPAMERAVGIDGTWGGEIVEELAPQEGEYVIAKNLYSAFQRTDFDLVLKRLGVRHLFVTGIGTPTCVEATARDAYFHEYFPVLIEDCCGGIIPETHEQALFAIKRRYGWVTNLESWTSAIAEGVPDFKAPD